LFYFSPFSRFQTRKALQRLDVMAMNLPMLPATLRD